MATFPNFQLTHDDAGFPTGLSYDPALAGNNIQSLNIVNGFLEANTVTSQAPYRFEIRAADFPENGLDAPELAGWLVCITEDSYYLPEASVWSDAVYAIPEEAKILGGINRPSAGNQLPEQPPDNQSAQVLTNRTVFLRDFIGDIEYHPLFPVNNVRECSVLANGTTLQVVFDGPVRIHGKTSGDVLPKAFTLSARPSGSTSPVKIECRNWSISGHIITVTLAGVLSPPIRQGYDGVLFYNGDVNAVDKNDTPALTDLSTGDPILEFVIRFHNNSIYS